MKRFFLIPLLACFSCVMAWGTEIEVFTFDALKTQLSASGTADVVKLGANITYGSELLNIQRSLTLDGNGYTITGNVVSNLSISSDKTFNKNTVFAVNKSGATNAGLVVTIQNLKLTHSATAQREIPFVIFDGVTKFTLDKVETDGAGKDFQALLITGSDPTPVQLVIKDSKINNLGNYPMYILKPITATLTNTTIAGWCGMYFKYQWASGSTGYGNTVGSAGSEVNADACSFDCPNPYAGKSNNFAIFPLEDHNITLNLHNCSFNADNLEENNDGQRLVNLQYNNRTENLGDCYVNISGDNTHIYNIENNDPKKVFWNGFVVGRQAPSTSEGLSTQTPTDLHVRLSGGTLNVNPESVRWLRVADNMPKATTNGQYNDQSTGTGAITIPDGYKVNEVNQGGVPVWRVVPVTTTLYNLNSDVPEEEGGAGQNPNTSFELSDGSAMTLNQATTKAGYVEVSNATTVTVATDQNLVINNGLDVQGTSSVVTAQPGSALVIGEGGIVTESSANIVVEANQNGAASLLLDPAITVNQTPELTVKMVAHNVGKIGEDYFWHRFALPIDQVRADDGSWSKDGHSYGTLLYKWDYTNNKWASLQELDEMKPFYGYTLSLEETVDNPGELKDAGYIFKGNLTGNVNSTLEFSRQGYNFFGNSYTGYISVLKLVDELIGNADIDGTVWMWNSDDQQYEDVPLNDLRNNPTATRYTGANQWKAEVAPMQTFILRLLTENTDATAEINYATAVWGNPRYDAVTGANNAPVRRVANTNDAYARIIVADANGKKDAVKFLEDANLSDAYDKGFDGAKYMNDNTINVYTTVNGENYGTVATDNLAGKTISIRTNDAIAYTISFADVEGNEYALRDNATNQVIAIEEGATYEFYAQSNSTIEGRFEIIEPAKLPTAIENTEVKANIKGIYTLTGQYVGENFEALPAGVYVVNGVKIVK